MTKMSTINAIKAAQATNFQKKVWIATFKIPKGQTRTYKQIAKAIKHPNSYRAVGSALKANPFAPIVPCHRVVKSDGSTGNYSGKGGAKGKVAMLRREGALKGSSKL